MGDYFDTAQQGIDTGKASLLAAIAQHGTQAQQALQQAQAGITAQKQTALQQVLAGARQRGAPQAELDQLSSTVGQPYDQRLTDLTQAGQSRQAASDQLGQAANTYMTEAGAAIPTLRTQLAGKVATLQAAADARREAAAQQAADRQSTHDLTVMRLQQEIAKAQSAANGGQLSDAAVQARLGGLSDQLQQQDLATLDGTHSANASSPGTGPRLSMGDDLGYTPFADQSREGLARNLGGQLGVDPTRLLGIFPPSQDGVKAAAAAAKAQTAADKQTAAENPDLASIGRSVGLSAKGVQQMFNTPEYKGAAQLAEAYVQSGRSVDDLKAALGKAAELQNKPKTRAAILAQYSKQLTSPAYIPTGP